MSVRRRTFVRNLVALPKEAATRKVRTLLKRDQTMTIAETTITLPPDSRLPFYQWRDPTYDTYAAELLARACSGVDSAMLIDIGANVGDTAVLALTAAPNLQVTSVEGSPYFLEYLRSNVAAFASRSTVVPGFVGPIAGSSRYSRDGSTGGFQPSNTEATEQIDVTEWVSVEQLLAYADPNLTIWKSDTDGFDIHLAVENWSAITDTCEVIWLEYDPVGTLGPKSDIESLIDQIAASGRVLHVYDNVGHHMVSGSGQPAATALRDLTGWLRRRRQGFAPVLYFDLWIATPELDQRMWPGRPPGT